jgi:hypothetical protein
MLTFTHFGVAWMRFTVTVNIANKAHNASSDGAQFDES